MPSSYEYSSYSSSAGGADAGALFAQADANNDGVIDRAEFANLVGGSDSGARRVGGAYGLSSYESSSYSSGVGLEGTGLSGRYHSSSYESTGGYDSAAMRQAASYTADSNAAWTRYGAEVRGVGLYVDPNPEFIRREAPSGTHTYTQKIQIRYLQPPPVAQQGILTIKEVRPPQPPALPPLRIKQVETAVGQLPPLILRERPPLPPASLASETIIRNLPALPVPPRSVIIERYAAAKIRPRDIIIERWLPYGVVGERKTIVQRAESARDYPLPHNVIIQYESTDARVVRQFQHLGVTQEDPHAYLARYGAQLLDAHTLVQEARAAGVVEDITTPPAIAASGISAIAYSSDGSYGGTDISLSGGHTHLVGTGYETTFAGGSGGGGGYNSSTYESTSYSSGGVSGDVGSSGFHITEAKL